jgi:hypothetical protein
VSRRSESVCCHAASVQSSTFELLPLRQVGPLNDDT